MARYKPGLIIVFACAWIAACRPEPIGSEVAGQRQTHIFTRQECLFIYPPANLIYVAMRKSCLALAKR